MPLGKETFKAKVDQILHLINHVSQERLNGLAMLSIGNDMVDALDYTSIISIVATKKIQEGECLSNTFKLL